MFQTDEYCFHHVHLRDALHFHTLYSLNPSTSCHFTSCLNYEQAAHHSFCSPAQGSGPKGKFRELHVFSQEITMCVITFEYLRFNYASLGLQATQTILTWWDFHLGKSQQFVKMTANVTNICKLSCNDSYPWNSSVKGDRGEHSTNRTGPCAQNHSRIW